MKRCLSALMIGAMCLTMPAQAVDFWHSNTVWANQGMCSAVFSCDSGMQDITDL